MAKAVCPFCSHEQETKSKLINITCSSCAKKYPNPFSKMKIESKPSNNNTPPDKELMATGKPPHSPEVNNNNKEVKVKLD